MKNLKKIKMFVGNSLKMKMCVDAAFEICLTLPIGDNSNFLPNYFVDLYFFSEVANDVEY